MTLLDADSAKALAIIVVANLYGSNELPPQFPLHIEDRADSWLVKGTPYTNVKEQARFYQTHIFIRKADAKIVGFGTDARIPLDEHEAKYFHSILTQNQFDGVFGPARSFKPWSSDNAIDRIILLSTIGGFLKKPQAALDYAYVIAQSDPLLRYIPKKGLSIHESGGLWHVKVTSSGFASGREILAISL